MPMLSKQFIVIGIVAELDPVPKAVARTCVWKLPNDHEEDKGDCSKAMNDQAQQNRHEVFSQLTNDFSERFHFEDFGGNQEEHTNW